MRREPAFSSLDFESPRASDQRYGDSRQSAMLWSAQFRETPVSTASGSLSVHQGSSICCLPPNWFRSISSASGRRLESIGIYRLNFSAGVGETEQVSRFSGLSRKPNDARGSLCAISLRCARRGPWELQRLLRVGMQSAWRGSPSE
jgi:hypothetical protein